MTALVVGTALWLAGVLLLFVVLRLDKRVDPEQQLADDLEAEARAERRRDAADELERDDVWGRDPDWHRPRGWGDPR